MLGLLKPKPPLEIREKVWTERRMHWLAQRFGLDTMKSAKIVLPTREFFPNEYGGELEDIADVFGRVCDFMGTNSDRFDLRVKGCCQDGSCRDAKEKDKPIVQAGAEDVADQERLIATLARAVAAQTLVDSGHVNEADKDFDSLTDLTAVFMGLGIFQANTAVKQTAASSGGWEYFSIRRAGCLQARVPGYAMALMAWIRDEPNPAWSAMLGTDASVAFRKGYKYVTKTNDCLFRPDNAAQPDESRSTTSIADALRRGTETEQLAALWNIRENSTGTSEAMDALAGCIKHRNPGIAAEAARTVAAVGPDASASLPAILEQLSANESEVRTYCAMAVGAIKPELDSAPDGLGVREELSLLLQDRNPLVVDAALNTFALYGKEAESAFVTSIPRIVLYARDCEFGLLASAVSRIATVIPNPREFFTEHLASADAELRDRILSELDPPDEEALDEETPVAE